MTTQHGPWYCPFCGIPTRTVRILVGHQYEMDCQECERTAIILADDYVEFVVGEPPPHETKDETR